MKKNIFVVILCCFMTTILSACSNEYEFITLPNYIGIEIVTHINTTVEEQEVLDKIRANLQANLVLQTVTDRPVQIDDIVNMDIIGTVNGKEYTNSELYAYEMKIGSEALVRGFDEKVIGHTIGQTISFSLTFPEDYYNNSVAGKDVLYYVKINGIRSQYTPDLTDDFVRQVSSKSTNLDEYRIEIREELEAKKVKSNKQYVEDLAWEYMLEFSTIEEYPQDLLDQEVAKIVEQYEEDADKVNMILELYIGQTLGINAATFKEQNTETAKLSLKEKAIVYHVAQENNINLTQEEYVAFYNEYTEAYGYNSISELLEVVGEETLQESILTRVVKNFIGENVVQVYKKADK